MDRQYTDLNHSLVKEMVTAITSKLMNNEMGGALVSH
jgi:hypothetical protein